MAEAARPLDFRPVAAALALADAMGPLPGAADYVAPPPPTLTDLARLGAAMASAGLVIEWSARLDPGAPPTLYVVLTPGLPEVQISPVAPLPFASFRCSGRAPPQD